MKFLCVPCDTPMKLQAVAPPERGSLSVVYTCPECGYEIAMLTNAAETQIVQSLGVRIGPEGGREVAGAGSAGSGQPAEGAGGCPFAAMIPPVHERAEASGVKFPEQSEPAEGAQASLAGASAQASGVNPPALRWAPAAEARLTKIPEFIRPMARTGIEKFARERGAAEVDEKILDAAREFFGM